MIRSDIPESRIQNVRILNSGRTLISSIFKGLRAVSEFGWILDLNSWILAEPPYFLRRSGFNPEVSLSPTLTGYRVVASAYAWPHPHASAISTTPKPGGDASSRECRRPPHHTASNGEEKWINRV